MPSIVATIKVREDKVEEAKAFFRKIAAQVEAEEPGTVAYVPLQRRDDPTTFMFYEEYESGEALGIHSKNVGAKAAEFGAVLAGPPEIVVLEKV